MIRQTVRLEKQRFKLSCKFDLNQMREAVLRNSEFTSERQLGTDMVVTMTTEIYGKSETLSVPHSWWDHFKLWAINDGGWALSWVKWLRPPALDSIQATALFPELDALRKSGAIEVCMWERNDSWKAGTYR